MYITIDKPADDLNKEQWQFTVMADYRGDHVAVILHSYMPMHRATKRHKWQASGPAYIRQGRGYNEIRDVNAVPLPDDVIDMARNAVIDRISIRREY